MQRSRQKYQADIINERDKKDMYHEMDISQVKQKYSAEAQMFKQQLMLTLGQKQDLDDQKQEWVKEVSD